MLRLPTGVPASSAGSLGSTPRSVSYCTTQQSLPINICSPDFSPALRLLGRKIVATLGGQCITSPPLTRNGAVACQAGDTMGVDDKGATVTCRQSCLASADCVVSLRVPGRSDVSVPRCAPEKFAKAADKDCGASCPCWRIVPKGSMCKSGADGSPYGLEILRRGDPEQGSSALVKCATTTAPWGSPTFAKLPQCS